MHFLQHVAASRRCLFLFWGSTFCVPMPPALSNFSDAGSDLTISLPTSLNNPVFDQLCSGSIIHPRNFSIDRTTWSISESLSLAVTICNWEPDPATIRAVLAAAATAVGKKPATGLLESKFIQKSDNKYNTLLFEIRPEYVDRRLTWGVVGEVLGESNGLPKFFKTTGQWHTVYFDVMHTTRGQLGNGAVRRWWQLESVERANETKLGNASDAGLDSH